MKIFQVRTVMKGMLFVALLFISVLACQTSFAEDLRLQELIDEALKNSPEILASEARTVSSRHRIPQAGSLPDPMFMFGYQNEGWQRYTYGEMEGAQWMFSASQMFPFPGKLAAKQDMARQEYDASVQMLRSVRLKTIERISSLYFDLLLSYKTIELLKDKLALFEKIEAAAIARYSTGMGQQQDVLMAQTEKYMLLEREEMQRQKISALEGMLNAAVGRDVNAPLGRPEDRTIAAADGADLDRLIIRAFEHSPEILVREKIIAAAEAKLRMAEKEYYPDFTLTANYFSRGGGMFQDMWSLTTAVNIPLYYRTKQKEAVLEAEATVAEARKERDSAKLMVASAMRESFAMQQAAGRLMGLYRDGLIPKAEQDFESALAGYSAGKSEAMTVISRLRALIESEISYWVRFVEHKKASVRFSALSGSVSVLESNR